MPENKLLNQEEVRSAEGTHMLYVLHGIFGAGRNWSSVIRQFVRSHGEWNARLLDLRQHGLSQGFAGPHTIKEAAHDIEALATSLSEKPDGILGHSFGGKVALQDRARVDINFLRSTFGREQAIQFAQLRLHHPVIIVAPGVARDPAALFVRP